MDPDPLANVRVDLGSRGYYVCIRPGSLSNLGMWLREQGHAVTGRLAVVVADDNTARYVDAVGAGLTSAGFQSLPILLPPGEQTKNLATASHLYDVLAKNHADRSTLVVAVGGGVVGDVAGFVAATYARGLPWVVVPTTLLAMVDSAIGGKVGVNLSAGKNLIGAFHQPLVVWSDPETLATLPEREFRSGLAEVVKYGAALDAKLFADLEFHADRLLRPDSDIVSSVIASCCRLKAKIVEQDEHEITGVRAVLNYGHTFAHAFEVVGGYGHWLHGEAVAAGMICAARLGVKTGRCTAEVEDRQAALLARLDLPVRPDRNWSANELLAVMRSDKKARAGRLRFVLPTRLGEARLADDITDEMVLAVLQEMNCSP